MMALKLLKDRNVILFSSFVFFISLSCFFYSSFFVGMLLLASLVAGLLLPFMFFNDGRHIPNLLSLFIGGEKTTQSIGKTIYSSCSICSGDGYKKNRLSTSKNHQLHIQNKFLVPQSVDEAMEELLNLVLDHHIYSWYKEITVHDQLADEIRFLIRYSASALASRLTKVDLTTIIVNRLIPAGISHLDAYVEGSRRVRGNMSVESSVIQYLKSGNGLHKALLSRDDEAAYLRAVVASLFPILIPIKYQDSQLAKVFLEELLGRLLIMRGLDLLADPDTVNLLFLILLTDIDPNPWPPAPKEPNVLFLKAFSSVNTYPRNSVLRSNLSTVLKDTSLLSIFHSFLKEEGATNILAFCLAVENFNSNILRPDLTSEQLKNLHLEAYELYHTFLMPTSDDKLDFLPEIVDQIKEIIHSEVCDIVKLRTTRPLFQAYEYAYNLLEREYLPLFMNCNAYFFYLCGSKSPNVHQRTSSSGSPCKSRDLCDWASRFGHTSVGKVVVQRVGSGLAQIGRQMALKPSVIVGDEDTYSNFQIEEAGDISSMLTSEECPNAKGPRKALESLTPAFRDLSAWRVAIPKVEQRFDANGKMSFIFVVDVTRIDVSGDNPEELHWEVERRFHEFYILEAKLTEFHGEFPDNVLPPRRSLFTSKGINFMQSKRMIFEEFLQKLLQKPSLKGSQLLFLFLKTKDEFTTSYLPDVSIGRLLKEVPRKLMKERGQKLDTFVSSFIESTSYKNKQLESSCFEDQYSENVAPSCLPFEDVELVSTIFRDNAQSFQRFSLDLYARNPLPPIKVSGVYEIVLYVLVRLYGLSLNCVRWAICIKALIGNTIDAAVNFFLRKKLSEALAAPRLVKLIHLIRDALFFDPPMHRSELERMIREKEIRREVINLMPMWIQKVLFTPELYVEGANSLVNLFQHPILNKQLSYVLLDIVLEEVFPELRSQDDDKNEANKFTRNLNPQSSVS